MKQKNDLLEQIELKFTERVEVSQALQERLASVPFKTKKTKKINWLVAASVIVLLGFNVVAISKKAKVNKVQYVIEEYTQTDFYTETNE